ncbi:MAG: hypothetical protein DIU60_023695 [Actinomycetes bacterium]
MGSGRRTLASGRSRSERPDVVWAFLWALLIALPAAACKAPPLGDGGEVLELESSTVRLEPGVVVADVELGGEGVLTPDTTRIRVGDVVRFTAGDSRAHTVVFERDQIDSVAVAYLDRTAQLRSPPLLTTGSQWIVSFEGAPPGVYPFVDIATGARGVVLVVAPATPNP